MSRLRMCPTLAQEQQMLLHCARARYIWNLAVEQRSHWRRDKGPMPGYVELARHLTETRTASAWLREGNAEIQQQALRDFDQAVRRRFESGFGEPTWRKKYRHEGFRVIGTDRLPAFEADGSPKLNAKGRRVMARSVRIEKLNRRWARVNVPGCGAVRFRLTKGRGLPVGEDVPRHLARRAVACRVRGRSRTETGSADRCSRRRRPGRDDHRRALGRPQTQLSAAQWQGAGAVAQTSAARRRALNRSILAQGWGALRSRTADKAPGRVEDVPAPYTRLRCSACGWIEKDSRKSQAEFVCVSCGFTCNADINAAINVAAGHAEGTTLPRRSSVREPRPGLWSQPALVEIPALKGGEDVKQ